MKVMVNTMKKNNIIRILIFVCCFFVFGGSVYAGEIKYVLEDAYDDHTRYAIDDASADSNILACGSKLYIENIEKDCVKGNGNAEICKYTKVNGVNQTGWVYRDRITPKYTTMVCKNEKVSKIINATRYLQNKNINEDLKDKGYYCGIGLEIAYCTANNDGSEEWCHVKDSGVRIQSSALAEFQSAADNFCGNKTNNSNNNNNSGKYSVLFYEYGGYGLECNNGTSYHSDGVCQFIVDSGSKAKFPVLPSDNKLLKYDTGLLMGWTKDFSDGEPVCEGGDDETKYRTVEKSSETVSIKEDTKYYACYKEMIGGWRYLQEGAEVSIPEGANKIECGTKFWVDYCINEDGTQYCYGILEGKTRKLYRNKITMEQSAANVTCAGEQKNKYMYVGTSGSDYACGEALYVTTCSEDTCVYNQILKHNGEKVDVSNKAINKKYVFDTTDKAKESCDSSSNNDSKTCKISKSTKNKGEDTYSLCYDKNDNEEINKKNIAKYYQCNQGYTFDKSSVYAITDEKCVGNKCSKKYNVNCKMNDSKPTLEVTPGVIQSNSSEGVISVKALSKAGKITKYYVSEEYLDPTSSSSGWQKVNGDSFTITSTPGIKYIWVMDSKGNISNGVSGAVLDNINTNTTAEKIELYDANGNIQSLASTLSYEESIKSNKYLMISNDLMNDSKVAVNTFNPFNMEYKLEIDSPTVSVYVTLTSSDSNYVTGYEPRTVNLKYGVNTILIKIQNKEGKIRTYTILVTRTDDRTSDNTLSELSVSEGSLNFNSNVTDYKVEIQKNTSVVNVKSNISSDKANYVEGYEPGDVKIEGDTTVKLIKVISQTGSTRTYVITFVKKGTDNIKDSTLQLSDLVIPGVNVPFESDVSNYSFSVDYSMESIDLKLYLNDPNSRVIVSYKRKNDSKYQIGSPTGMGLDVGENFVEIKVINSNDDVAYYRLTIIRKEFGLNISNDSTLKDMKVLGYDIKFSPDKKDYTVKIKQEKSLVITAVPANNRAEVFIRGNDELTGFSTVRVKVVAENGTFETYSIDIKKDAFNKSVEIASIIAGGVIILISSCIIIVKKNIRKNKEYLEE